YAQIRRFEQATGQAFANGLEVSCHVAVRFHPRYGLKLEVLEIDPSFTLGQMELQRQRTLDRLLHDYPAYIQYADGEYRTSNKALPWPRVMQRVALIAAPGSDGYRDFVHELQHNAYGYRFQLSVFPASVQGQQAVAQISAQLDAIWPQAAQYDVVALVRGGGSTTDFAPFDDYEVAQRIARFPIPVFTGIGHDRNTSIADLMGCQFKTPTKVAAAIVDTALHFESQLMALKDQLSALWSAQTRHYAHQLQVWDTRMQQVVPFQLHRRHDRLQHWQLMLERTTREEVKYYADQLSEKAKRIRQQWQTTLRQRRLHLEHLQKLVTQLSPETVLNRGYAMVMQEDTIITDPGKLNREIPMQTVLKNKTIISQIKAISNHEKENI
nr:exodeoxyribonuclease VII large subunit [Chitinophagaceae bacterium]